MRFPVGFLKKFKYYIVAGAFILTAGSLFLFWRAQVTRSPAAAAAKAGPADKGQSEAAAETYVRAFRVKRIAFKDVLKGLTGTVRGSSVELKSSQEERLLQYRFKSGDKLRRGDVIAELDHTRSLARFRQSEIELDRKKKLFDVGGASRMELRQAEESCKIARKDYEDTFITAPKNGYLGETLTQEGELVTRQTPIAYFVSAEDPFFVETSIIEKRITSLVGGQRATVAIDMYPGKPMEGTVLSISPEVLTTSRMAPVRVALAETDSKKLRPGLSASCDVVIFNRDSLVLPLSSLIEGKDKVFVIEEGKHARARDVTTGYKSRDYVELVRGLDDGAVVVVNADFAGITDGAAVRYSEIEEYKDEK